MDLVNDDVTEDELHQIEDLKSGVILAMLYLRNEKFSYAFPKPLIVMIVNESVDMLVKMALELKKDVENEKSYSRCFVLLSAAGFFRNGRALFELGYIYWWGGLGKSRNKEKALKYLEESSFPISWYYAGRAAADLQQIEKSQKLFQTAYDSDCDDCVGELLCMGFLEGVEKDLDKGFMRLQKIHARYMADPSDMRISPCFLNQMGRCYRNGWGVAKDKDKARALWQHCCLLGMTVSMYNYALFFESDSHWRNIAQKQKYYRYDQKKN